MIIRQIPIPKLAHCLREGYSLDSLGHDLIAGVTVGLAGAIEHPRIGHCLAQQT